jgi:sigma-B regulation protein RsbU (phosphoserine phosphatase)
MEGERYAEASFFLSAGDRILFYTDGITEAQSPDNELFGTERLDLALSECSGDPRILLERVLAAVDDFTQGRPATDDRTLLVADVF